MKSHAHFFETGSKNRKDAMKPIRTDMGTRIKGDFGIGTGCNQRLENRGLKRMLRSRIQLAVRIGTGSPFTEE
jgi:hypothetical protein